MDSPEHNKIIQDAAEKPDLAQGVAMLVKALGPDDRRSALQELVEARNFGRNKNLDRAIILVKSSQQALAYYTLHRCISRQTQR